MAAAAMRRPCVRRFLLALLLVVPAVPALAPPARAQDAGVRVGLVSQPPWTGPDRPLTIAFRATNATASPLTDLSVVLSIFAPARSRSVYELSLRTEATPTLLATPFPEEGGLDPGATRTFRVRQTLEVLARRAENALYPVKVELRSGDVTVATIRTPMVFLAEPAEVPLNLVWTWALADPLQAGPDGVFGPGPLEGDLAPGGRISAMVSALEDTPGRADVAVSPVLVGQLEQMARGYRSRAADGTVRQVPAGSAGAADAARVLGMLRRIAARPATELVALPYADARLPSLFQAGLGNDLPDLLRLGRDVVAAGLRAQPSSNVARPPLSEIDAGTTERLAALGASTLLVDQGVFPVAPGLQFSPSPVVRGEAGGRAFDAVVPDAGVMTAAAGHADDPVLAARAALGELAAIWFEFPGTPGRGAAVTFPEGGSFPPAFFPAFASLVRASPWLRRASASGLVSLVQQPRREPMVAPRFPSFPRPYVERLLATRGSLHPFRATVGSADGLPERLRRRLLLAEGGSAVDHPGVGLVYVASVRRAIATTYERVHPPTDGIVYTLTSQRGFLPLTVTNDAPYPMRVWIRLVADRRLVFPQGNVLPLTLDREAVTPFRVPVRAQGTGRFPIKLQILAPVPACGSCTLAETQVIIRSTAYNRVALVLTIGAGLFLLGWWGRRFLPRRRS
jgi:Family of unknown function (DUF6049)